MKPILKPPGTKHLTLKCGILLSTFGFKFNLRHYNPVGLVLRFLLQRNAMSEEHIDLLWDITQKPDTFEAGAYTRPLLSSTLAVSDTKHTLTLP
jgi:hypothetical protein